VSDAERRAAEIAADRDRLVAMTPAEHVELAATISAEPVSSHERVEKHLHALVHVQLAIAKGGVQ